jgi:hypothetical protein
VPKTAGTYADPANRGAAKPNHCWIIPLQTTVGMASSRVSQNLLRNITALWPACFSCPAWASS